jgi:hypothetical protein
VAKITPSTVWLLNHASFRQAKSQQQLRVKVSFCVHDRFEGDPTQLINLAATLKSPSELVDTFLKAVIRTKAPLSYQEVTTRYQDALQHIQGEAELNQVAG